jgi:chromosome partitioning protein
MANSGLNTTGLIEAGRMQTSFDDLARMAEDAGAVISQVRSRIMNPEPRKIAPTFSFKEVADICNLTGPQLRTKLKPELKAVLGIGEQDGVKSLTLKQAQEVIHTLDIFPSRPKGQKGKIITIGSYKGGVGKTTTAVTLAHGLTLRGLKVLLVDLDGQGSATTLCGISPEVEVDEEQTIMPFIYDERPDLSYAVKQTYWDNLSLIPASSALLAAEYVFPAKIRNDNSYQFWAEIKRGLDPLLDEFDVAVLDTSPTLGYLTQNAMFAADGLVAPCPLEALDCASLAQFWSVYVEIASYFPDLRNSKSFDFVDVLITKAKPERDEISKIIKEWVKESYKKHLCDVIIPDSSVPKTASAELKTVYELKRGDISSATFRRYKGPVDAFTDHITSQLAMGWN